MEFLLGEEAVYAVQALALPLAAWAPQAANAREDGDSQAKGRSDRGIRRVQMASFCAAIAAAPRSVSRRIACDPCKAAAPGCPCDMFMLRS